MRHDVLLLAFLAVTSATEAVFVPQPSINRTATHVEEGDEILFHCEVRVDLGQALLLWLDYPGLRANKTGHVSCINETDVLFTEKIVKHDCTLKNLTHADEGDYICRIYFDKEHENNVSMHMEVFEVVNVPKPSIHTLANHVEKGDDVTFHCEVEVQDGQNYSLWLDYPALGADDTERVTCYNEPDTITMPKFRKLNCTLKHVKLEDAGNYSCRVSDGYGHENKVTQYMRVFEIVSVPQPSINRTATHVEEGDEIVFHCEVRVDLGQALSLWLDYPGLRANKTGHVSCINETDVLFPEKIVKHDCTLKNLTHADEGDYICRIYFDKEHENNVSMHMEVFDRGTTYLNLSLGVDTEHTTVDASLENYTVYIPVRIIAHPDVENITWFKGNSEIKNSGKFVIKKEKEVTTLQLLNVTLWDSGTYKVEASHAYNRSELTFSLVVIDLPKVSLQTRNTYIYNSVLEVNCTVVGNPPSEIRWESRFCDSRQQCEDADFTEQSNDSFSTTNLTEFTQLSTLRVKAHASGQVRCVANGYNNTDVAAESDVIITEEETTAAVDGSRHGPEAMALTSGQSTARSGQDKSKYPSLFQGTVTTLAFLAFGAYILSLAVSAARSKYGTSRGLWAAAGADGGEPGRRRRRRDALPGV